jgi:hypothetical protein
MPWPTNDVSKPFTLALPFRHMPPSKHTSPSPNPTIIRALASNTLTPSRMKAGVKEGYYQKFHITS